MLVAMLSMVAACGPATAPAPAKQPNVFVFLVDTLRADRVGAYGGSRARTPFLDTLAARAAVFDHAYAQSSWTAPSVTSLFTSRYQSQHGVVAFGSPIDANELTIAELMRDHGYATAGFLANPGMPEVLGYAQGFETYKSTWPEAEADPTTRKARAEVIGTAALKWLDALPKGDARPPVFVYLHYLEPHMPYSPPGPMLERIAGGRVIPNVENANSALFFAALGMPDAAALRNIEEVYDAEVLSLDEGLRRTFAALEARHLLDDAVVVFTADHGEEFEDHGHLGHGGSLYEEVIHVPLLISVSSRTARLDVREPVALIDVAPTIADLAGIPAPASFEGRSLRPTFDATARSWWQRLLHREAGAATLRPILTELIMPNDKGRVRPHERAVIVGRQKLIVGKNGETEQYDLARDPAEESSVATPDPALARILADMKTRFAAAHDVPTPTVPAALNERLKALGYVQ